MLTPNTVIQNYRLVRKLGEGGMGEVWLAEHLTIARKVAIKVLHAQYARNPKIQQRFRNEAATLSKLKHPNIVALYDFIESDSDIYLVMEYVEGRNLEEVVRTDTGPMPTAKLLQVFKQILSAVGYAHQQGVVHRDIKPSNFMIGDDGVVKVLDFGIAKLLEDDQHLTKTGLRMGTTFYMSPEQVNTEAVDHRSDIYSLGVTLFFLATGKAPYEGETSEYKVFDQIVRTPLPAGRTVYVGVAPEVDAVIAKATKKAPADRFQGCGEFWEGFAAPAKPVLPKEKMPTASYPNWKRISAMIFLLSFIVIAVLLISKNVKGTEPYSSTEEREILIADSIYVDSLSRVRSLDPEIQKLIDDLVYVEGGTFEMGSNDGSYLNTRLHTVTLSSFEISKFEVTQAQWQIVMSSNPSNHKNCNYCPVEMVTWYDAIKFIDKLNLATGKNFRLPTEAEWEFAARGGLKSKGFRYAGSNDLNAVAWNEDIENPTTHPVGGKEPNELGLFDMNNNVAEWCQDWYEDHYSENRRPNPMGPSTGTMKVNREPVWIFLEESSGYWVRSGWFPDRTESTIGFRLARDYLE